MTERPTTAEVLAAENHRLRNALEAAEERARLAEAQLMRVHRAVRAAQQNLRNARQKRNEILTAAQQHASKLVQQAQHEAERITRAAALSAGAPTTGPDENKQNRNSAGDGGDGGEPPRPAMSTLIGSRAHNWADNDPTLDDRLEQYLETELEPDASREWILGDRAG